MDALLLARWQFAITTVYHFFFVPLTLGLVWVVAIFNTLWVTSGREVYGRLTKFWGKLFLINFAMGVVTGIVQEFQFGMNWSEYSRFVGDIFGAPLAIEALLAFFLESTFLGIWVFGWDVLPKKVHLAAIWVVAVGSNLSALWILIANSFMQQPVGYVLRNGRAEMNDFWALVANGHVWVQFPHVMTGAMATAAFFMLAVSAWHLLRARDDETRDAFRRSFRYRGHLCAGLLARGGGRRARPGPIHGQGAADEDGGGRGAVADGEPGLDVPLHLGQRAGNAGRVRHPGPRPAQLSRLQPVHGRGEGDQGPAGAVQQQFGPGDYSPPVMWTYWTFRGMVGAGAVMLLLAAWASLAVVRERIDASRALLSALVPAIVLPYLANSTGWLFTEMGRQPWIVFGLQKTAAAVSPSVSFGELLLTLVGFTLIYGVLMAADIHLLRKYATAGLPGEAAVGGRQKTARHRRTA